MGQERKCQAEIDGRRGEGIAHLEPGELRFAGHAALRIPLGADVRATATGGRLAVEWPGGAASFELGPDAETWALKIRYPRSRLDKLGVTPQSVVAILGVKDTRFNAEVRGRAAHLSIGRIRPGTHMAIVGATTLTDLDRLAACRDAIAEHGAIWVVWTKGQKALTETHVREAAKAQGLVDVKVMSFSPELSALKLMIPRALRTRRTRK